MPIDRVSKNAPRDRPTAVADHSPPFWALVARYEEHTGRSMSNVPWYTTQARWKSAIFLEGSYKRRLAGTTEDPFFARLTDGVPEIAERARRTAARAE